MSRYEFLKASLTDNAQKIWLRESDGFVLADSLQAVRGSQFHKLFEERSFITTLEAVRDKLNLELDYNITYLTNRLYLTANGFTGYTSRCMTYKELKGKMCFGCIQN